MSTINDMYQGDTDPDGKYKSGVNKILSDSMAIHGAGEDNNGSDAGFVRFSETNNNRGEMMLATGDNGNEPIVANQYLGEIPKYHIDLMDKEGNQRFNNVWSYDINLYEEAKKIEPIIEILKNKKFIQRRSAGGGSSYIDRSNKRIITFKMPFKAYWEFTLASYSGSPDEFCVSNTCEMTQDYQKWIIPEWNNSFYFYRTRIKTDTIDVYVNSSEYMGYNGRGTPTHWITNEAIMEITAQTDLTRLNDSQ